MKTKAEKSADSIEADLRDEFGDVYLALDILDEDSYAEMLEEDEL